MIQIYNIIGLVVIRSGVSVIAYYYCSISTNNSGKNSALWGNLAGSGVNAIVIPGNVTLVLGNLTLCPGK
jgi:hypothetical protein